MPSTLGAQRPFGYGYWPLPEDDPGVHSQREPPIGQDGHAVGKLFGDLVGNLTG